MSGTGFGINYLISITTQNLDEVDRLYRQLKNLQALAREGADFAVRIEKGALDGITTTVAKAVAEGVAKGGGQARIPSAAARGDAGDEPGRRSKLDRLLRNMEDLTRSINGLAGRQPGEPGAPRRRSYPGDATSAAASHKLFDDVGITAEMTKASQEIRQQVHILRRYNAQLSGLERMTAGMVSSIDKWPSLRRESFEQLRERAIGGIYGLSKKSERQQIGQKVKELTDRYRSASANPDNTAQAEELVKAHTELYNLVAGLRGRVGDTIADLRERVEREKQQLMQLRERQGGRHDERTTARQIRVDGSGGYGTASFVRDGGGRADGFGTLRISLDKAGLEAAFTSAAGKFAERVIQTFGDRLPMPGMPGLPGMPGGQKGGLGGGTGGRPATGPGSYGTNQPEMPIVCGRCGGTGVYYSKEYRSICMRCGGTGIENMPNTKVIQEATGHTRQFSSTGKSGSVPSTHVGGVTGDAAAILGVSGEPKPVVFQPTLPGEGVRSHSDVPKGMRFIPHSMKRREELYDKLETHLGILSTGETPVLDANGKPLLGKNGMPFKPLNLDVQKRPVYQEHVQMLMDEYERGGIFHPEGNTHKRTRNGVLLGRAELKALKEGKEIDPVPYVRSESPSEFGKDLIVAAEGNVHRLTEALQQLEKTPLDKVNQMFKLMAENMAILKNDLQQLAPLLQAGMGEQIRVQALEKELKLRSEQQKQLRMERQASKQERERGAALRDADMRRELLLRDERLQAMDPNDPTQRQRLFGLLGRNLRRYASEEQAAVEQHLYASSFRDHGLPVDAKRYDRAALNASRRRELTGDLAISRAERLAALEPQSFGDLAPDIAKYRANQTAYSEAQELYQRLLRERQHQHDVKTDRVTGTDGRVLSEGEKAHKLLVSQMQEAQYAQTLSKTFGLKVTDGTVATGEVSSALDKQYRGLLNQQDALVKIVAKKHESLKASEGEVSLLERFGQKLRELTFYMGAGGLLYGSMNLLRGGVQNAVRFESDLAELQGIFVGKSSTERDQIKSGVMDLSYQYGVNRSQATQQAKIFAQTGASPENTLKLTNSALLATRGAGLNPDQAAEMLIAVQNLSGGRVTPADMIDRISRIEARYPVTAQDLSLAVQRVGSVATEFQPGQLGGVDAFDAINGMVTSIVSKTRVTGNQAATGLRFMLARLNSPGVQKSLQTNFGISLGESNSGELRPLTDILGDVAGKYQGYLSNGQSAKAASLLTTFAGARQSNLAAALFGDWKSTMDIAKESSLAFGDSQKRLAIQLDTLAARMERTGTAFDNFMSVLLESSGIMGLLKGGTSLLGSGLQSASKIEGGPALLGLLAGVGTGSGLLALGTAGKVAATGMLGYGAGAATAVAGTALMAGSVGYGSYKVASKLSSEAQRLEEFHRMQDLYGPTEFDRKTYLESEQGQAYVAQAKTFGLSGDTFYDRIGQAVAQAQAKLATDPRFGGENGVRALLSGQSTNPRFGRAMESALTEAFKGVLPGFGVGQSQSDATQAGLAFLRTSMQYGGVGFLANQSGFIEQANREGQTLRSSLYDGGTTNPYFLEALKNPAYQLAFADGRPEFVDTTFRKQAYLSRSTVGFNYTPDIGNRLGHTDRFAQFRDVQDILNAFDPQLGLGTSMSSMRFGGKGFLSLVVDQMQRKMETLGQALDDLTETFLKTDEGGKQLDKAMRQSVHYAFDIQGRNLVGGGAQPGPGGATFSGGKFAERILAAYNKAVSAEMQQIQSSDPRYKAMQAFLASQGNPDNRQRTLLDIAGAQHGFSIRSVLTDRMMAPIYSYSQRMNSIDAAQSIFGGAGLQYDAVGQRAESARSLMQSIAEVHGQIPVDAMKAMEEWHIALAQAGSLGLTSEEALQAVSNDEESVGRIVLPDSVRKAGRKLVNQGISAEQIAQLEFKARTLKGALTDFRSKPKGLFSALGDDDRASLNGLLGISDPLAFLSAAQSNADLLDRIGVGQRGYTDAVTARSLGGIEAGGSYNRLLSGIGASGDLVQSAAAAHARLAEIAGQPGATVAAVVGGISSRQATAYQLAESQRNEAAASLKRDGVLEDSDVWKLRMAEAGETFKTAIQQANQEAQRSVLQLMTDARIKYAEAQEQHLQSLASNATQGLRALLTDPSKLSFRFQDTLLPSIGQSISGGLADSLMSNLLGPDGLFGQQLKSVFNQPLFQEAQLIKMAHIEGITEGMARAYQNPGGAPLTGVSGTSVGGYLRSGVGRGVGMSVATLSAIAKYPERLALSGGGTGDPAIEAAQRQMQENGITAEQQRLGYKGRLSRAAYRNIKPWGYPSFSNLPEVRDAVKEWLDLRNSLDVAPGKIPRSDDWMFGDVTTTRENEDAWRLYLGLPQVADTFGVSSYRPQHAKRKDGTYFELNDFATRNDLVIPDVLRDYVEETKANGGKSQQMDRGFGLLENYQMSTGHDKEGDYLAYYDIYDFDPALVNMPGAPGHPYDIYDRLYYDPKTYELRDRQKYLAHASLEDLYSLQLHSTFVPDPRKKLLDGTSARLEIDAEIQRRQYRQALKRFPNIRPSNGIGKSLLNLSFGDMARFTEANKFGPTTADYRASLLGDNPLASYQVPQDIILTARQQAAEASQMFDAQQKEIEESQKALRQQQLQALKTQLLGMAGNVGGSLLGGSLGVRDAAGRPNNYASVGASLGTLAGSFLPFPGGSLLGGLVGGFLGGRFGGPRQKPLPDTQALALIEEHTRATVDAITNQTKMMSLDSRFLNVPSGFQVPYYNPFPSDRMSSGLPGNFAGTIEVNVQVPPTASSPQEIGDAVAKALADQLRGGGTYSTTRF
jgi:hypothetical protein